MSMTQSEYNAYKAAVEQFFKKEGINCLSGDGEQHFSHRDCECCRRSLAGDRENAKGFNQETREINEYSVCVDCLYYVNYGQLDDMTMIDMKDS